jgi:hypothetical protein
LCSPVAGVGRLDVRSGGSATAVGEADHGDRVGPIPGKPPIT